VSDPAIHLAALPQRRIADDPDRPVEGAFVELDGERFYRIGNVDRMPTFIMTLVGASDLWMFVASNGGLTAGRVDAESALFPYLTHDRIIETAESTGPATLLVVERGDRRSLWEPFTACARRLYEVERNLYKSELGSTLIFEEVNRDLELAFRYAWRFADRYGVVRTARVENLAGTPVSVELLDGLQNLLPTGVTTALQATMSNLLDAYKRAELDADTGLGLFTLSSTLTDVAEPMESLRATTVWQSGLEVSEHLLSTEQLDAFRQGCPLRAERDLRGRRGAYFVRATLRLDGGAEHRWHLVAEVGQDHADVAALRARLANDAAGLTADLEADLERGDDALADVVARADGQQWTADRAATARHVASVLFNVMRGGTFPRDEVDRDDLIDFVRTRDHALAEAQRAFFGALPASLPYRELVEAAASTGSADLERLCRGYLPLAFSRRHGDPSRPWNRFAIRIRHPDGRPRLDYQGNWRDIFQNWEALAHAFPDYAPGMVCTFLNATTADGYNPYRLTRDGFEWEEPEPDNPWANIGYWSDHQIVYLQKLLEVAGAHHPGALEALATRPIFAHADVPYRLKPYEALLEDPYATIAFDRDRHDALVAAAERIGSDGKLLRRADGSTVHVTMTEKLLTLLLAKLGNFVPEGGLWMNTQRPEWNDANNALVGKGLSVVTIAYLVRFVAGLRAFFGRVDAPLSVSRDVATFLARVDEVLAAHEDALAGTIDDARRRTVMDGLGRASSAYRERLYREGPSAETTVLDAALLDRFLARASAWLEHTLRANRRDDALFHAYNLLVLGDGTARVEPLYEMLEGQVAALSSGLLSTDDALALLASLRVGRLYRPDQHSYLLYPDRDLPGFLEKNRIPSEAVAGSALVDALRRRGDVRLIVPDVGGALHFAGDLANARTVRAVLRELAEDAELAPLVEAEGERIVALFDAVFDHASFTGRSGAFFAYEGLGSIYWHMVSKLQLAVLETWRRAAEAGEDAAKIAALAEAYYDVRAGLGFHKTPQVYGAFPTDPYSHTPAHAGAQQPGMTGQVKEDVLTRIGELGVDVRGGRIRFAPGLLRREEFLAEEVEVEARTLAGRRPLRLPAGSLAFTVCQVPVVYALREGSPRVRVTRRNGEVVTFDGRELDPVTSREVFARTGAVTRIDVDLPASDLAGPA
jgi:hypothetical protein